MKGPKIRLGKLLGITFQIDPTWFVVFTLITLSLTSRFAEEYPHWTTLTYWMVGILTSILFFVSVVLHELAHSAVAISKGIPVRSITLFIFGGVAQISREASRPGIEFLVAAAGPAASIVISLFFGGLWLLGKGNSEVVAALGQWLAEINLMLALFNLIPGFPLDGGRILRSIIWGISGNFAKATRAASTLGKLVAYLFIIMGGWFLLNAAQQSFQQIVLRETLSGIKANDMMTRDCPRIPPGITVAQFLEDFLFQTGRHCFLIMDQDMLLGIITLHEVNKMPREHWDQTRVEEIMLPLQQLKWVSPDQDIVKILEYMDREDINQVPVVEQGRLLGMVGRHEILRLLQRRLELST
ncbi:MAG: peptidase [Acidobacteria bacterium]|nr:MAG: peptidase [Acidobacteriota bacterium]